MTTMEVKFNRGSVPSRVHQILEADGGWMSLDQLRVELEFRFGVSPARPTIDKAMTRLIEKGVAAKRLVPAGVSHSSHTWMERAEIKVVT